MRKDPRHELAGILKGPSAALLLVLCSCIYLGPSVPVRVSVKTKDISGNVRELDFTFLKAGQTTRQEVARKLAPIDTTTKERGFFWGRWESSSWVSAPLIEEEFPNRNRSHGSAGRSGFDWLCANHHDVRRA